MRCIMDIAVKWFLEIISNTWITALIFCFALLCIHYIWAFGGIHRHGLSGPTPIPFFGNSLSLFLDRGEMHLTMDSYVKKYGKVFGMYFLRDPAIVVSDPVMLKEIYVKEFNKFRNRAVSNLLLAIQCGLSFKGG